MNIRMILISALCANIVTSAPITADITQYPTGSVLYFDRSKIYQLIEKVCLFEEGNDEMHKVVSSIAKRRGASAVVDSEFAVYVNPAYDVTQEVMDSISKAYMRKLVECDSPQEMLHEAILRNSPEAISIAIKAGANVNSGNDNNSPLLCAVLHKRSDAVKCLLRNGAMANDAIFQEALVLNDTKSAALLAKKCGANLNAVYSNGYQSGTLLQLAANNGDLESVLSLIRWGASFSGYIKTSRNGERDLMELTMRLCSHSSKENESCALELIQELINHGYDIDDIWRMYIDEIYWNKAVLELLIKNKVNPNQIMQKEHPRGCTWTPLFKAIDVGSKEAVEVLLDAGANINQKADPYPDSPHICPKGPLTPLAFAAKKGYTTIIELLRERGASL